jgi:8-oxo-dGTP diphosphatase
MKKIEVVAAIIFERDKFVITKRAGGLFDGLWEFPGGKIEPNETHVNALKREINEELNIKISIESYLNTIEYDMIHSI